jgi:hypothetical protein
MYYWPTSVAIDYIGEEHAWALGVVPLCAAACYRLAQQADVVWIAEHIAYVAAHEQANAAWFAERSAIEEAHAREQAEAAAQRAMQIDANRRAFFAKYP